MKPLKSEQWILVDVMDERIRSILAQIEPVKRHYGTGNSELWCRVKGGKLYYKSSSKALGDMYVGYVRYVMYAEAFHIEESEEEKVVSEMLLPTQQNNISLIEAMLKLQDDA